MTTDSPKMKIEIKTVKENEAIVSTDAHRKKVESAHRKQREILLKHQQRQKKRSEQSVC